MDEMERDGTRWNEMERDGTRWNEMERDGTKRDERRRNKTKREERRFGIRERGKEQIVRAKKARIEQGSYLGRIEAVTRGPPSSEPCASIYSASCDLSHAKSLLQDQHQLIVTTHCRTPLDITGRVRIHIGAILRYV